MRCKLADFLWQTADWRYLPLFFLACCQKKGKKLRHIAQLRAACEKHQFFEIR